MRIYFSLYLGQLWRKTLRGERNEENKSEKGRQSKRLRDITSWVDFRYHFVTLFIIVKWLSLFLSSFHSFSGFFTRVKSELRSRSSGYSDISESEDSGPECTALVRLRPRGLYVIWWKDEHHVTSPGRKANDSFSQSLSLWLM